MTQQYKAVVVGLGQIGNTFDFEKEREGNIWTHSGAYLSCDKTLLLAGSDLDEEKILIFKQKRGIEKTYKNYISMLDEIKPDIVSICVPTEFHYEVTKKVLEYPLKGIILEKPISYNIEQSEEIINIAQRNRIKILVMYQRRYWEEYILVKNMIEKNIIGDLISITGFYTSEIYNIGSHLFNTMRYFAGDIKWVSAELTKDGKLDKTFTGILGFENNIIGYFIPNNSKFNLLFDFIIIGTKGKIEIGANGKYVRIFKFNKSNRYAGYNELSNGKLLKKTGQSNSAILKALNDLIYSIENDKEPISNGIEALKDIILINKIFESVKADSRKIYLKEN